MGSLPKESIKISIPHEKLTVKDGDTSFPSSLVSDLQKPGYIYFYGVYFISNVLY